jgi:hypothetical protein
MHCARCGAEVAPGSAFCAGCGTTVTDPGAATVLVVTAEEQDQLLVQLRRDLAKDYEVEKELGRGGMAVVYRAQEIELRRLVALKVLPPGLGSPDMAERFRREARMAAALDHPNIIPIYRVGQAAGTYFFAMKFVEGRAVDAILEQQGALPVAVVLHVLRATASALAFAHARQIVHRDIKGANILVDRDGRVLVSDFGIARAAEEKTLTASGSVIGTPHFMSPEQCSGQKVGPQSDQYSLGVLAFQMLTGQVPFDADSVIAIIQHHYFTPVPDVRAVREDVPEALLAVVYRALAKDAAQRFASTDEMVAALDAVPGAAEDRARSEALLRDLARGEPLPRVRTGSLPPLADVRTIGAAALVSSAATISAAAAAAGAATVTAPVAVAKSGGRRVAPLVGAMAVLVLAAAAGGTWLATRGGGETAAPATDTLAPRGLAPGGGGPGAAEPGAPAASVAPEAVDSAKLAGPGAVPAAGGGRVEAQPRGTPADGRQPSAPTRTNERAQRRAAVPQQPPATPVPAVPAAPAGVGYLRVSTVPPDAQVFLDGRKISDGSAVDLPIPAGSHRLRIAASGYNAFDTTISVEPGNTVRLGRKTLSSVGGP